MVLTLSLVPTAAISNTHDTRTENPRRRLCEKNYLNNVRRHNGLIVKNLVALRVLLHDLYAAKSCIIHIHIYIFCYLTLI